MRSITLRALVVGGGGNGPVDARSRNPGPGGGQVQDVNTLRFVAGSYTVTVGAGGSYSEIAGILRSIAGGRSYGSGSTVGGDGANGAGVVNAGGSVGVSLVGGFNGGAGNNSSTTGIAGGGAGAGAAGSVSNGGDGIQSDITGTNTYYGGGSGNGAGTGGQGGGASGGGAGTANTGGGGFPGGSGIVILRWNPATLAAAGLTLSFTGGSTTTGLSGGDSIRTWTSSGSFTVGLRSDYALSGTVTLAGTPVSGAVIRVIRMSTNETVDTTTTDGSGNWSMQGVSQLEEYDVVVEYTNGGTFYNAKNLWKVVPV